MRRNVKQRIFEGAFVQLCAFDYTPVPVAGSSRTRSAATDAVTAADAPQGRATSQALAQALRILSPHAAFSGRGEATSDAATWRERC